jgi:hypothetical protein
VVYVWLETCLNVLCMRALQQYRQKTVTGVLTRLVASQHIILESRNAYHNVSWHVAYACAFARSVAFELRILSAMSARL